MPEGSPSCRETRCKQDPDLEAGVQACDCTDIHCIPLPISLNAARGGEAQQRAFQGAGFESVGAIWMCSDAKWFRHNEASGVRQTYSGPAPEEGLWFDCAGLLLQRDNLQHLSMHGLVCLTQHVHSSLACPARNPLHLLSLDLVMTSKGIPWGPHWVLETAKPPGAVLSTILTTEGNQRCTLQRA